MSNQDHGPSVRVTVQSTDGEPLAAWRTHEDGTHVVEKTVKSIEEIRHVCTLVADDAENDAQARVEFTPLGIGTTRGEILAMIHALAKSIDALAQHIEIGEQP